MVVFILSFVASVLYYQVLTALSLALMIFSVFLAVLVLIPLSIVTSSLYELSFQFHRNLEQRTATFLDKQLRRKMERQLKACPLIRVQMGGLYYMEAQAKLTMLSQVINSVVGLLVDFKV